MDTMTFLILVLMGGAFLLLSSRAKKQQRQSESFRSNLQVGDDVMTSSGMYGTIIDIDGDVITLESPSGGRTDWLRAAIGRVTEPPWAPAAAEEDEAVEGDEPVEGDEAVEEDRLADDGLTQDREAEPGESSEEPRRP